MGHVSHALGGGGGGGGGGGSGALPRHDAEPPTLEGAIELGDGELVRGRWARGSRVGSGSHGEVFLMRDTQLGVDFAAKLVYPRDAESAARLEQEIAVMQRLRHEHIVRYLGCARDVLRGEQYILMEYVVGGTVKAMLARSYPRGLPLTAVQRYGRHLLSGLHFLHEAMIIHSDLKGDNLLVDLSRAAPGTEVDDSEWGRLKIADFGSSRELSGSGTHSMHEHALRGSPYWLAPEAIRGVGAGRKADVWALGGVLLEMLTGKPPWFEEQATPQGQFAVFQILNRIVTATGPPPLPPAETMPPALHDLLLACFERNLAKRPTTTQLLAHPWIGVTDADAES